ncbi:DUF748 domain-containing protein [Chitinibacter sp. ZOR0017]|uniref:DUF748 domain-containing protein n=1 Tax=Chitinibacter sp. ZOR0017 TaxID=1339254 RepID=UPI000647926F|nr:DUF748 domain-containing protein [Chitinibacter sp. ZOR0017]
MLPNVIKRLASHRWGRRLGRLVLGWVVLGLIGMLALPPVLKPYLEQQASAALQRSVTVGELGLNPFTWTVTLRDLRIRDRYGDFVVAKEIRANAEVMSLLRGGPVLRELTLVAPQIRLVRLGEREFNFSDLLQAKPSSAPSEPLRFALNNIQVQQGEIALDDRYRHTQQRLDQLELAIPFISNLPQRVDEYIAPLLRGRLNGQRFALQGQSKPFKDSLDTSLEFDLQGLKLQDYLAYTPLPAALQIPSAVFDSRLQLVFRQQPKDTQLILKGQLALRDVALNVAGAPALRLRQAKLELGDLQPLRGQWHLQKLGLDGLELHTQRAANGQLNWQQLAPATPANSTVATTNAPAKTTLPDVKIGEFTLRNSQLHWQDAAVSPAVAQSVQIQLLSGQHWALRGQQPWLINLQAQGANASNLTAALQLKPQPLQIQGKLAAHDWQLADWAGYAASAVRGQLRGLLNVQTELQFQAAADNAAPQLQLQHTDVTLRDLGWTLPNTRQPAVAIGELAVQGLSLDTVARQLQIQELRSGAGKIALQWLPDNELDLQQALVSHGAPRTAAQATPAAHAAAPWRVQLANAQLDDYQLKFENRHLAQAVPLGLQQLQIRLRGLDTQPGHAAQLSLQARSGRKATLALTGTLTPQPFAANLQLDTRSLDAAYAQPYFSRLLNISLASGFVDAKGRLKLSSQPQWGGGFQGDLALRQFYALDKATGEDFLKWKTLAFNGINSQFAPVKVEVRDVLVDQLYSRLILSPNGRMNVQDVLVSDAGQVSVTRESAVASQPAAVVASRPASDAELPPIKVGKIRLQQGNVRFSDLLIKPNYTANLTSLNGEIQGLDSAQLGRATLNLKGSLDQVAPVSIAGTLNPLAKAPFFDLRGSVQGYELTSASSYAQKYAGYGIVKGKLSSEVSYRVENRQLKASNQIFLDQLTLGNEKTDGPEVTKLPVKLALALLKDRRGQIKLNLPVEGSLDDPQFKLSAVIWQVIGNLLEKVVTAPFDALSGMGAGGPSQSYVVFESGSSRLSEAAQQAIQQTSQLLNDRPALQLELSGWAARSADEAGLKTRLLNRQLRALKARQLGEKAQSLESEQIQISAEERAELLGKLYSAAKFDKPSNVLGLAKSLPPEQMEALLLQHQPVTEQDLRTLAEQRAKRVDEALKAAGLPGERIFLLRPNINPSASDGGLSRVQFKLQ